MIFLVISMLVAASDQLLADGAFEKGVEAWKINAAADIRIEPASLAGRPCAKLFVPSAAPVSYPQLFQDIEVQPGTLLEAHVDAMPESVSGGYGVYAALEFHDAGGKRLTFSQSDAASREKVWAPLVVR